MLKDFNEPLFMSKADNIFIKFFTAIMLDELKTVDHFVSDDVYEYGESIINYNKEHGYQQMYDMLNVKKSKNFKLNNNSIEGNNKDRIEVNYLLTFKKNKNTEKSDIVKRCPGCGRSVDVNDSGACEYCGAIYNQEDFDWILTNIEEK